MLWYQEAGCYQRPTHVALEKHGRIPKSQARGLSLSKDTNSTSDLLRLDSDQTIDFAIRISND